MSQVSMIQQSLNNATAALGQTNAKIAECLGHIQAVSSTKTGISYVLENDENITFVYHLAGTPYLDMTTQEMDTVTQCEDDFKSQKESVLEQLNTRLKELQNTAFWQRIQMNDIYSSLQFAIALENSRKGD